MTNICIYKGKVPIDNLVCNRCPLFLQICIPIADEEGYAQGSECDCYLCEGCINYSCIYKDDITLYGIGKS